MENLKLLEIKSIPEIRILPSVRIIELLDLNHIYSKDNLRVQYLISGEASGAINCHLCLDQHSLTSSDKNYLYPLFVESMNILIGHQISHDKNLKDLKIKLSPPKFSIISKELNTAFYISVQRYALESDEKVFDILIEHNLQIFN